MIVNQEKIAPPGPLPLETERPGVLHLDRKIESLKRQKTWLRAQLNRLASEK
jgi:hypothetical protein